MRLLVVMLFGALLLSPSASAQDAEMAVDVVVVSGPIDARTVRYVEAAIGDTDAALVVLQLDAAAVFADIDSLTALVADADVPVAVWAGPAPGTVRGDALRLLAVAPIRGAAPGVVLGPATSVAAGDDAPGTGRLPVEVLEDGVVVDGTIPGLVEFVEPSIGQFLVGLDGVEVVVNGAPVVLDTAVEELVDGVPSLRPAGTVRFVEEGVLDRVLHTALRPEAAFFFLLAGLALATFEFYAVGPGFAAGVAVLFTLEAGYGLAVLPVWWPALALIAVGVGLFVWEFQRNGFGWRTILGAGALMWAGLGFTAGADGITPSWWVVSLTVLGTTTFFGFALTAAARARFSTQTVGREHLIGRTGVAVGAIAPMGEVSLDGSHWRARSTRRSGIDPGDEVVIVGIDGIVLEVDPAPQS
ncbi:MAG: NfeD family protein [Acidimicrobiia bacterium]|nr:MAG: NfeD family protein [Acidimicrobiia bacterium]